MTRYRVTVLEQTCSYDDYDTENGDGIPADTPLETVAVVETDDLDTTIAEYGVSQYDGGHTAYDPDGAHMAPDGTMTQRFAAIDRMDDGDDEDEDLEEDGAVIETPVPMTLRFEKGERVRHVETGWFGEVIAVSDFEDGDPAYKVRWDVGDRPTYTYRDYMLDREYLDGANA